MKKLLLILLCLPLLFTTCKKEEDDPIINNTSNIEQIIVDKIWKGRVPYYQTNNWDIIFELRSNDSLYIYTSGCLQTTTNIGTWNISGKIITYNQVSNSTEYLNLPFGELTEYSVTQLKFKLDNPNVNAICEIYNISTQNCTHIPDNNFEDYLINMGYDDIMDDYVLTSNIDHIEYLDVSYNYIYNLTGIEDFTALTTLLCVDNHLTSLDVSQNTALTNLNCSDNHLTSLDVSQNTALTNLSCYGNQLTSLDLRNGNNTNMYDFYITNNPNLTCISVDYPGWSTNNWFNVDSQHYFSEDCSAK